MAAGQERRHVTNVFYLVQSLTPQTRLLQLQITDHKNILRNYLYYTFSALAPMV